MGNEKEVASDNKALNKHRIMQESLVRLSLVIYNLDDLIDEIKGTSKQAEVDKKVDTMPLGAFLVEGNSSIVNMTDKQAEVDKKVDTMPLGAFLVEGNSSIVNMTEKIGKINAELRDLLF